jgi:hypothetical protein
MPLSADDAAFVRANPAAAMITVASDGTAKAVRVAIGLLDDRLVSSGTRDRARTARLRRDPRCTLYVQESGYGHLVLETVVSIDERPSVPADSLRLFRMLQGKPEGPVSWFGGLLDDERFLATMVEEGRVLYEFDVRRRYGMR